MSEAIESVGRLIAAFPNGTPASAKGYIGALAAILMDYPRSIALRCADPRTGVARETRFLPTVADLVAWCERETAEMRTPVDREDGFVGIIRQMEARRIEGEAWDEARKTRPSYDALKEKHGPNWGLHAVSERDCVAKAQSTEQVRRANKRLLEQAYAAAGTAPAHPLAASPMLVARLAEQAATRAAIPPAPPETRRAREVGKSIGSLARAVVNNVSVDLDDEVPF